MQPASSTRNCWTAGAVLGLVVWLLTAGTGSLAWFEGLLLGIVAAWLLGAFLIWLLCRGEPAMDSSNWQPVSAAPPRPERAVVAAAPAEKPAVASESAAAAVPAQPRAKPAPQEVAAAADPAGADDLKQIKGIGPKLEELLHAQGITRFEQIAAWDDAEMDRFAELIGRMGGRIRSDDWVGQARALAAGGVA